MYYYLSQRFVGKGLAGFIQKPHNMAALRGKPMEIQGGVDDPTNDRGDMV